MKVLKFGGTSVGSAQRIKEVAKLITDGEQKIVVPDIAESTTIFCSPSVINLATSFIRCAEPTEVPPNFKTFIFVPVLNDYILLFVSSTVGIIPEYSDVTSVI